MRSHRFLFPPPAGRVPRPGAPERAPERGGVRGPVPCGFALLELLLVVTLLLLFSSAAVMNLSPLWRGARLDEGVGQLESLLRFARAEAAHQGRRIQLHVQAPGAHAVADPAAPERAAIEVRWEPEPLEQPGVFVESRSSAALARSVAEHVRIEQVRRLEPVAGTGPAPAAGDAGPGDPSTATTDTFEDPADWPPIMFYPDGSSDSAEILVGSTDAGDARRMLVKWNGLSGSTARQELDAESLAAFGGGTAEAQPLEPASVARTALGSPAP